MNHFLNCAAMNQYPCEAKLSDSQGGVVPEKAMEERDVEQYAGRSGRWGASVMRRIKMSGAARLQGDHG
jgi:hypothetical protein